MELILSGISVTDGIHQAIALSSIHTLEVWIKDPDLGKMIATYSLDLITPELMLLTETFPLPEFFGLILDFVAYFSKELIRLDSLGRPQILCILNTILARISLEQKSIETYDRTNNSSVVLDKLYLILDACVDQESYRCALLAQFVVKNKPTVAMYSF